MNKIKKDIFITSDIHGHREELQKSLKDIGFKPSSNDKIINVGSSPEYKPEGEMPDLATLVEKVKENIEKMQKANDSHHDAQYKKIHGCNK
jgi:uncharacterized protein YhaN